MCCYSPYYIHTCQKRMILISSRNGGSGVRNAKNLREMNRMGQNGSQNIKSTFYDDRGSFLH